MSLNILDRVDIHGRAMAYVLAVLAKAITIREKTHRVLHAKKWATHRPDRTVRVRIVFWHLSIALLTLAPLCKSDPRLDLRHVPNKRQHGGREDMMQDSCSTPV